LKSLSFVSLLNKAHETELLFRKFLPIFYRKVCKKSMILNKMRGSFVIKMLFAWKIKIAAEWECGSRG